MMVTVVIDFSDFYSQSVEEVYLNQSNSIRRDTGFLMTVWDRIQKNQKIALTIF